MAALSQTKLEQFLSDIREENSWRISANKEADYYDGNQLDGETLQEMEQRGIAPLIRNLIGPTIDVVLGMEAKNKRDWKVVAETDDDTEVAEALNVKLKQAERVSEADRACSEAYASQVKVGIGWVEVAREHNPFRAPYRVRGIHRNEIFWDWRAKELDLGDARYLVRRRWLDEDELIAAFPNKKSLIENVGRKWPMWDSEYRADEIGLSLAQSYDTELRTSLEEQEWRDLERKRLCLYEVWYRVWERGYVLRLPNNTVIEFDLNNSRHTDVVANGLVQPEPAMIPKVRLSWWIGPHRLSDTPSPYAHNRFPYVPMWGYREDRTGIPYGLIRRMMSPQDEVNARLSKMMWLLSAKRVITDSDAVAMTHDEVLNEAGRPDAYITLNPNRKNKDFNAFRIESDFQLSQQQFEVLRDASQAINDTGGVYQAMLGKESSAESGLAINSLVEQGATTLAEINDNYRYGKKLVGELLLSLVKEDIGNGETTVSISFDGAKKAKKVVLNHVMQDKYGYTYRSNDLARTKLRVDLDDVPNTPSYRAQQLQNLTEISKSLPPELQVAIVDLIVRATDLPQRNEIADRIAKVTGQMQPDDLTPEEIAAQQAEQEKLAQLEALEMADKEADIDKKRAEAEYYRARTDKTDAETGKVENDTLLNEDKHSMEVDSHIMDLAERAQPNTSAGDEKASKKPKRSPSTTAR